ncbi:MAG: hypothetical protein ACJAWY_002366, partial [Sphingomonas echinoides]
MVVINSEIVDPAAFVAVAAAENDYVDRRVLAYPAGTLLPWSLGERYAVA